MGTAEDHLPPPLSHWFMELTGEAGRHFTASFSERKELIKGQLRYLGHQLGAPGIKSYEVLEQVFE